MDHSKCSHPKTKAARAKCRREQATDKPRRPAGNRPKLKAQKKEKIEATDVVARHENGTMAVRSEGPAYTHAHPDEFPPEEVRRARQYLFGR